MRLRSGIYIVPTHRWYIERMFAMGPAIAYVAK